MSDLLSHSKTLGGGARRPIAQPRTVASDTLSLRASSARVQPISFSNLSMSLGFVDGGSGIGTMVPYPDAIR